MVAAAFTFQADLSSLLKLSIVWLASAVTIRTVWSYVLLRGPRAVRALEWVEDGYCVCLGQECRRIPAVPAGCRTYGRYLWLLRFETGEGPVQLFVDPGCQDPRSLRRLARRLARDARNATRSGRSAAAS